MVKVFQTKKNQSSLSCLCPEICCGKNTFFFLKTGHTSGAYCSMEDVRKNPESISWTFVGCEYQLRTPLTVYKYTAPPPPAGNIEKI